MTPKKIAAITFTAIASLMVVLSGCMKLAGNAQIVETLTKVGVADYMLPLGVMEIGFTALFIYPKTMKIGFILLTCYFAGALATELSHGATLNAALPLTLIWIAAFLRDRSVFLSEKNAEFLS